MFHKYIEIPQKMHFNLDENICRLCLLNVGFTNIFNEENIAINIMKCSRIKAQSDDGLPYLICRECAEKLNVSLRFREQCEKSDRQLRQQFGKCYGHDTVFDIHDSFLDPVEQEIPEKKAVEYVGVITFASHSDNRTACIVTENNCGSKVDGILNQQSLTNQKKLQDGTQTKKKYQCDTCGRIFNKCSHLTVHSRIHTGEKPFKCSECDKTFIASHHLLAHQRVHNNERPYQCTHCGKCFSEVSSLSRHTKVHTGDKKYACPHCPKRFITQCDARRHVFKHTGETPFRCQICFMSYAEPSSLSKHNKTHKKKKSESLPSVICYNLEQT